MSSERVWSVGGVAAVLAVLVAGCATPARQQQQAAQVIRPVMTMERDLAGQQVDVYGMTALHRAARDNTIHFVDPSIVNARDRHARTPLHIAATWGHAAAGEKLIAAGADIQAEDAWGKTPMRRAELVEQYRNWDRSAFIRMMRRHGAEM